jgi:hypothetical protein
MPPASLPSEGSAGFCNVADRGVSVRLPLLLAATPKQKRRRRDSFRCGDPVFVQGEAASVTTGPRWPDPETFGSGSFARELRGC